MNSVVFQLGEAIAVWAKYQNDALVQVEVIRGYIRELRFLNRADMIKYNIDNGNILKKFIAKGAISAEEQVIYSQFVYSTTNLKFRGKPEDKAKAQPIKRLVNKLFDYLITELFGTIEVQSGSEEEEEVATPISTPISTPNDGKTKSSSQKKKKTEFVILEELDPVNLTELKNDGIEEEKNLNTVVAVEMEKEDIEDEDEDETIRTPNRSLGKYGGGMRSSTDYVHDRRDLYETYPYVSRPAVEYIIQLMPEVQTFYEPCINYYFL